MEMVLFRVYWGCGWVERGRFWSGCLAGTSTRTSKGYVSFHTEILSGAGCVISIRRVLIFVTRFGWGDHEPHARCFTGWQGKRRVS